MKKFFDFLKQVFFGESGGLGSKTANMTPKQLLKVGTDHGLTPTEAENMVNAFITGKQDDVLTEITTSLSDTKKLMKTDEMIEAELRAEYIDGKAADTMSFEEFKLSKTVNDDEIKSAIDEIAAEDILKADTEVTGTRYDNAGEVEAIDLTAKPSLFESFSDVQRSSKKGPYAVEPKNVSNYDQLVEEGYYVGGSMKPGPNHPFFNPNTVAEGRGPSRTKVVSSNIAMWKKDLIRNLEEGIITRDEYDDIYRNAAPVFEQEYKNAVKIDSQYGYAEDTYENRNADKLMTDYWEGENYAPKYIVEEDLPPGMQFTDSPESSLKIQNQIHEELFKPIKDATKVIDSQSNQIDKYTALHKDAISRGDIAEAERVGKILQDAQDQINSGVDPMSIIFKDTQRTLHAHGGIIKGLKNRG